MGNRTAVVQGTGYPNDFQHVHLKEFQTFPEAYPNGSLYESQVET